jgi:hypothetical protein
MLYDGVQEFNPFDAWLYRGMEMEKQHSSLALSSLMYR